jgi:hypothetical protein
LRGRHLTVRGKVENPVLVDELVTEVEFEPPEGSQGAMIVHDPVGPNQHQHIGALLAVCVGSLLVFLELQAPLDLGPDGLDRNGQAHGRRVSAGMKDQAQRSALQIDGLAIIAPFASIGHQGIALLLALPRLLQLPKRSLHANQIFAEPDHFGLGSGRVLAGLSGRLPLLLQLVLPVSQAKSFFL